MKEEGYLEKTKRVIKKDRRHNERQLFDDESDQHKKAGRKGHSKLRPISEYEVDIDDNDPYAEDIQYMLRYVK